MVNDSAYAPSFNYQKRPKSIVRKHVLKRFIHPHRQCQTFARGFQYALFEMRE
jgi:hypothetical protein